MKTMKDYLNEIADKTETGSDYAVAKLLNISRSRMSNYRTGRNILDNEMCFKLAEILKIDPLEVIIAIEVERATKRNDSALQKLWTGLAKRTTAAMVALAILASGTPGEGLRAQGLKGDVEPGNVYYVKSLLCRVRRILARIGVFLALGLATPLAHADPGWFVEGGIGVHDARRDAPEVSLDNPLFVGRFGYETLNHTTVAVQHISSIGTQEDGYGLTLLTVTRRFDLFK